MITSWFTLNKLAHYLNDLLKDNVINKAVTFQKNELVLLNESDEKKSIKIHLYSPFQYILLGLVKEPRKHISIFPALQRDIIKRVYMDPGDRNLHISFSSGSTLSIYFRSNSGNITFQNSDASIDYFKKSKYKEKLTAFSDIPENTHYTNLDEDSRFNRYWKANSSHYFRDMNYEEIIQCIESAHGKSVENRFVLNDCSGSGFKPEEFYLNYRTFIVQQLQNSTYSREYNTVKQQLLKKLEYLDKTIRHLDNPEKLKKRAEKNKYFADTLNTLRYLLTNTPKEFLIPEEYRSDSFPVRIPLNGTFSHNEQIKFYYDKAAGLRKKAEESGHLGEQLIRDFTTLKMLYTELENCRNSEDLTELRKKLNPYLQIDIFAKSASGEQKSTPYKEYISPGGWTVWVGKSAKDNDKMTFKYASRQDMWLHTRHSTGSHVIIRAQGKKQIPRADIEFAAKLAARHSKEKHSGLVSVVYTLRKYVTKRKNFLPGKVTFQYEKDILVESNTK